MKKCIVMVVALVLVGMMNVGLCAGGGPILYNDRGITVMATDADIITDWPEHEGQTVIRIFYEARNDSDVDRFVSCNGATINNRNHIGGFAGINLGAHSIKEDTLLIFLYEAGMSSTNEINSFELEMTSWDSEGSDKYTHHDMKSKIPGSWLKRALQ